MATGKKEQMTEELADALFDYGPRVLTALDRIIEAADPGKIERCSCCDLRKVEHFRNEQLRANLRAFRDKIAKMISEADAIDFGPNAEVPS